MAFQFPLYTLVFLLGGLLVLLFAAITWMRRSIPGALPFSIFLIAVAIWTISNALESGATTLADKVFWGKMMYFGLVNVGVMWFCFALEYNGHDRWKNIRNLFVLYSIPMISLPIIWTNELHGWFWSSISPSVDVGSSILVYDHGFWFWILWSYQLSLLIAGFVILIRFMFRQAGIYRKQLISLLVATLLPMVANLVYVSGHSPIQGLDLTSLTFLVSGLIYALAFFRYNFLDIIPIACHLLVENLANGIIVLNSDDSVMGVNPAAARMVNISAKEARGKPIDQVWPNLAKALNDNRSTPSFDLSLETQKSIIDLEIKLTPLRNKHQKIIGRLIVLTDVSERHLSDRRLEERAISDELTCLYNHRHLHQRLDEEISKCSKSGEIFCLLSIDLDLFKAYNDIYGHLEGDKILNQVGQKIRNSIREQDIGFRYGGDEFAVILPGTGVDGAKKAAERIRKCVDLGIDTRNVPITCSIGIASWPSNGMSRIEILKFADAAMYYAKQTGRNRICTASDIVKPSTTRTNLNSDNSKTILNTIYALAATVDAKDHHTYGHSKKVSQHAVEIAELLGYSRERIDEIRGAALLHDIGKLGVSDAIIKKKDSLTTDEWEFMKAHPDIGVSIVKHVENLSACLAGIRYHHERYDGSGYPAGLKGENIPLDARIIAVADAFDAMISSRPYRKGLTYLQALNEIKRGSGQQFDPRVVDTFLKIIEVELASRNETPFADYSEQQYRLRNAAFSHTPILCDD